ncbi:MAG: hypothetical protein SFX73_20995 [Kofleriaceae bacterium]|nr:hypothetical protein [Kofleriaceae bacterium]
MTRPLPRHVIEVADGFWNIRAPFRVGPLNIGTHASLVRRANGAFVMLDACPCDDETMTWIREVSGDRLEAIVNLHPFHTVFVKAAHANFPTAKLYGTARHVSKLSELPWQPERTESAELQALFRDDFELSVPRGVDFIPADERLHFSSVLAFHPATKTLHVDDTILYLKLPRLLRAFKRDVFRLHPTLAKTLERRAGATADFRAWAQETTKRLQGIDNLCAAHMTVLLARDNPGPSIAERFERAVHDADGKLRAHDRTFQR